MEALMQMVLDSQAASTSDLGAKLITAVRKSKSKNIVEIKDINPMKGIPAGIDIDKYRYVKILENLLVNNDFWILCSLTELRQFYLDLTLLALHKGNSGSRTFIKLRISMSTVCFLDDLYIKIFNKYFSLREKLK